MVVPRPTEDELASSSSGNRFDIQDVASLYFASDLKVCFCETLARFRPKLELATLVEDEWDAAYRFRPGMVPQSWRLRRLIVRVHVVDPRPFLDLTKSETLQVLREELAPELAEWGYEDLDMSVVMGPDRRVTRLIAEWTFKQQQDDLSQRWRYPGIKYKSKLDPGWDCWVVFPDCELGVPAEAFPIEREMDELQFVARHFNLRVF